MTGEAFGSGRARRAAAAVVLAALAGCASAPPPPPPPPPPVRASVAIEVAADANPDASGRASPVVVRLYQLRGLDRFAAADFDALYEGDRDLLAADLVDRQEWTLRPGERRVLAWTAAPDVRAVAVYAALRDYRTVPWRASAAVPAPATPPADVAIRFEVGRRGVQATPAANDRVSDVRQP